MSTTKISRVSIPTMVCLIVLGGFATGATCRAQEPDPVGTGSEAADEPEGPAERDDAPSADDAELTRADKTALWRCALQKADTERLRDGPDLDQLGVVDRRLEEALRPAENVEERYLRRKADWRVGWDPSGVSDVSIGYLARGLVVRARADSIRDAATVLFRLNHPTEPSDGEDSDAETDPAGFHLERLERNGDAYEVRLVQFPTHEALSDGALELMDRAARDIGVDTVLERECSWSSDEPAFSPESGADDIDWQRRPVETTDTHRLYRWRATVDRGDASLEEMLGSIVASNETLEGIEVAPGPESLDVTLVKVVPRSDPTTDPPAGHLGNGSDATPPSLADFQPWAAFDDTSETCGREELDLDEEKASKLDLLQDAIADIDRYRRIFRHFEHLAVKPETAPVWACLTGHASSEDAPDTGPLDGFAIEQLERTPAGAIRLTVASGADDGATLKQRVETCLSARDEPDVALGGWSVSEDRRTISFEVASLQGGGGGSRDEHPPWAKPNVASCREQLKTGSREHYYSIADRRQELEAKRLLVEDRMPRDPRVPDLLAQLDEQAAAASVELQRIDIRPLPPTPGDPLQTYELLVTGRGDVGRHAAFVHGLLEVPRILAPQKLHWTSTEKGGQFSGRLRFFASDDQ